MHSRTQRPTFYKHLSSSQFPRRRCKLRAASNLHEHVTTYYLEDTETRLERLKAILLAPAVKLGCFKALCCCWFQFSPAPHRWLVPLFPSGSQHHGSFHHHFSSFSQLQLPRQQDAAYLCCFHISSFCCHNNTIFLAFDRNSNFKPRIRKDAGFSREGTCMMKRLIRAICKLSHFFLKGEFFTRKSEKADSNC